MPEQLDKKYQQWRMERIENFINKFDFFLFLMGFILVFINFAVFNTHIIFLEKLTFLLEEYKYLALFFCFADLFFILSFIFLFLKRKKIIQMLRHYYGQYHIPKKAADDLNISKEKLSQLIKK